MMAIKHRGTGEIVNVVSVEEMGWCLGAYFLNTEDGYKIASFEVDLKNNYRERQWEICNDAEN